MLGANLGLLLYREVSVMCSCNILYIFMLHDVVYFLFVFYYIIYFYLFGKLFQDHYLNILT